MLSNSHLSFINTRLFYKEGQAIVSLAFYYTTCLFLYEVIYMLF